MANRADAIQLWEPAYTLLKAKKPDIRMLDTAMSKTWKSFAGGERIPYLGVAAHDDWIAQNQALIPKLYATYKERIHWCASGRSRSPDCAEGDGYGTKATRQPCSSRTRSTKVFQRPARIAYETRLDNGMTDGERRKVQDDVMKVLSAEAAASKAA